MRPVLATLALVLTGLVGPAVPAGPARAAGPPEPAPHGVWPLTPRPPVVRGFDPPGSPWGAGHRGVDLLGRPGQQVHASRAGTITYAGTLAGRGVVVVDHGGERTTYEPVSASVAVGDHVAAGAVIGTLQAAMSHCPPRACLHWGLIRGDTSLDPLLLVGGGPVRLLPLGGLPGSPVASWTPVGDGADASRIGPRVVLTPAGVPVGMPLAAGRS
jgi:murein DD-endopeptidase MepM/ murein hydrolase activator NlpD